MAVTAAAIAATVGEAAPAVVEAPGLAPTAEVGSFGESVGEAGEEDPPDAAQPDANSIAKVNNHVAREIHFPIPVGLTRLGGVGR